MNILTGDRTEAASFGVVCRILDFYDRDPGMIIPILQKVQEEYRYLPEEVLLFLATSLEISPARLYGIATFYSHFSLEPKGKHVIKVCDGTACHVKGSGALIEALRSMLALEKGVKTTSDMLFTLETVSCLGACGLAPVVVIDDTVHGQMTPDKVRALITKIREEEDAEA